MDCTPCAMGVEWLRSAYASEWRPFKDRPDILVSGRYYRLPDDHPAYPGFHHFDSRNWLQPDDDAIELGESYTAKQVWSAGQPRGPIPLVPRLTPEFVRCLEDGEKIIPPNSAHQEIHEGRFPVVITGNGFPTRIQIPTRLFVEAIFACDVVLSGNIDFVVSVDAIGVPDAVIESAAELVLDVDAVGVPDAVIETAAELVLDVDAVGVPDAVIETAAELVLDVDAVGVPDAVIETAAELVLDVDAVGVPDAVIESAAELVLDVDAIGVPDAVIETGGGDEGFLMTFDPDVSPSTPGEGEMSWGQGSTLIVNQVDVTAADWGTELATVDTSDLLSIRDIEFGHQWDYTIDSITDNLDGTWTFEMTLFGTTYPLEGETDIGTVFTVFISIIP